MLSFDVFDAGLCLVSMFSLQVYVEFRSFRCRFMLNFDVFVQVYVEF